MYPDEKSTGYSGTGTLKVRRDDEVASDRESTEYRISRCEERIASLEKGMMELRLLAEQQKMQIERIERDLAL